jgi:hypothetical protein
MSEYFFKRTTILTAAIHRNINPEMKCLLAYDIYIRAYTTAQRTIIK